MADRCEILIVGAGPAGLAAAGAAAESGADVLLVDENTLPGGQIWRATTVGPNPKAGLAPGVRLSVGSTCVDFTGRKSIAAIRDGQRTDFHFDKLILATGARELFLPFPGWTLPGVLGLGGLQAIIKGGLGLRGKRVVIAGSGPLLLEAGRHVYRSGGSVVAFAEQATFRSAAFFGVGLVRYPEKLRQALGFVGGGSRTRFSRWIARADGHGHVEAVLLSNGQRVGCDYVACGYGLVPNTELAQLAGCKITEGCVVVDNAQATSVKDVWCAGEPTGIAGVGSSVVEGRIAGYAATRKMEKAAPLFKARERERDFGRKLARAFALRPELAKLCEPETLVCRCEDVSYSSLQAVANQREARLYLRCGMGPCQGKICGPATEELFGWERAPARGPIVPVPLGCMVKEWEEKER